MSRGGTPPVARPQRPAHPAPVSTPFADHFSGVAAGYARFRPRYPAALFAYLASIAPSRDRAWDCATGTGQAAVALAARFRTVVATDASARQIAHAEAHPRVEYLVASAEASALASASVDLVTVAQALHWFEPSRHFAEARRVLRPRGVYAAWCYGRLRVADARAQALLDELYGETLGPYWPAERRLVEEGYRSVELPFDELVPPGFRMRAVLTLDALAGYLRTWSATARYAARHGEDPVASVVARLRGSWGGPQARRLVAWPLALRVGRRA
jgi:SAM-dependent methyltransferase